MAKILNFGSLNIDHVFSVDHFVQPGETTAARAFHVFPGGKGLNQSIALAKAGAAVSHAAPVGQDGGWLVELMEKNGVEVSRVKPCSCANGKAIIQVDANGQNCILLYTGSNACVTMEYIHSVLCDFGSEDFLVVQNEVNLLPELIDAAAAKGIQVVLNPSPANEVIAKCNLNHVSWLILNEVEGAYLTGTDMPEEICARLLERHPDLKIVLTLGKCGSIYRDGQQTVVQAAFPVEAVDTTAAGDTFSGYLLAQVAAGIPLAEALKTAAFAAAITVTRIGAAVSIPTAAEVREKMKAQLDSLPEEFAGQVQ